jgi:hypothetical protein
MALLRTSIRSGAPSGSVGDRLSRFAGPIDARGAHSAAEARILRQGRRWMLMHGGRLFGGEPKESPSPVWVLLPLGNPPI